jgi:hypothetical protein
MGMEDGIAAGRIRTEQRKSDSRRKRERGARKEKNLFTRGQSTLLDIRGTQASIDQITYQAYISSTRGIIKTYTQNSGMAHTKVDV